MWCVLASVAFAGAVSDLQVTVLDARTDAPIEGISLTLNAEHFEEPDVRLTDDEGRYNWTELRAGVYELEVSADGWSTVTIDRYVMRGDDDQSRTVFIDRADEDTAMPEKLPRDYTRRYAGFGGVSYGIYEFPWFIEDGPGYINVPGTGVYSYFFAQIADSRWYAGFGVGANFFNDAFSSTRGIRNEVNGDLDTVAGVYTSQESFFHLPIEANSSYVWRWSKFFQSWIGTGFSIHLVNYTYVDRQVGISTDPNGDLVFWQDAFQEGGTSFRTKPGYQLFGGTEFIFGKIPKIGGEWGLGLTGKFQTIRVFDLQQPGRAFTYEEKNEDGSDRGNDLQERGPQFREYDADNFSLTLGLTFHYK